MKSLRYFFGGCIIFISACHKDILPTDPNYQENSIYSFVFAHSSNIGLPDDVSGTISNDTIYVEVPASANLASLTPIVGYFGISISPASDSPQNFSSPVHYRVTAGNGQTKDYVVIVSIHYKQKIFIGTQQGKFYALDGDTGAYLWSYMPSPYGTIAGEAAYENNTVFFCTLYNFYALDANTGTVKWSHALPYYLNYVSPIIVNNSIVYFSLGSQGLLALDANTGAQIWSEPASGGYGGPTYSNGIIYCSSTYGSKSFDALTGQPLLTFGNNFTLGNTLVSGNAVYNGSESKALESYNTITGSLNWEFDELGGVGFSGSSCSPTIHNGVVFNGGFTHYIYAVNSATGQLNWKTNYIFQGTALTSDFTAPTVTNGLVYSTIGNRTVALDELTGNIRWDAVTSGGPCTVTDRSVLVAGTDKSIVSLDAFTGVEKWRYTFSDGDYMINAGPCVVTEDSRIFYSGESGGHQ